ncbi:MAG: hypothetical protein ACRDMK_08345 [Gaiellaceae bacterium]
MRGARNKWESVVGRPSTTSRGAGGCALDAVRERFGSKAITRAVLVGRDDGLSPPLLPD